MVDDGSEDGTDELLQQFSNQNVRVLRHRENRGLAAARNTGMECAEGQILFFIDADITVPPHFVESHLHYYQRGPEILGIINGTQPGPEVPDTMFTRYLYSEARGASSAGEGGTVPAHQMLFTCSSLRRRVYESVGGFDETITVYGGEDTEYAFRIAKAVEGRFVFTNHSLPRHHHYRSLKPTMQLLRGYGAKTAPYLLERHPDIKPYLGLHYLDSPLSGFKTVLWKTLLTSRVLLHTLRTTYRILPPFLRRKIIKFLLGASLIRGYLESEET